MLALLINFEHVLITDSMCTFQGLIKFAICVWSLFSLVWLFTVSFYTILLLLVLFVHLCNKFLMCILEDIWDIEALVHKIFCYLIFWRNLLAFLIQNTSSYGKFWRSCRFKALINGLRVILETLLALLNSVKVVFFWIEWYVFLSAEVMCPRNGYLSVHLIDADKRRWHRKFELLLKFLSIFPWTQTAWWKHMRWFYWVLTQESRLLKLALTHYTLGLRRPINWHETLLVDEWQLLRRGKWAIAVNLFFDKVTLIPFTV